ncbi:M1 family metallopeptidase [Candidatus Saccharibacteria bacterium]|nr:M1 family metallopeptidase [Candidatus Saccharibacteria bacterium]
MQSVSRLNRAFRPDHYQLSVTLERKDRRFHGEVTIDGAVLEGAKDLRLHAKDLDITNVLYDGKETTWSHDDHDELVIHAPSLEPGDHKIVVSFSGVISDPMHGIYPCYYDYNGQKKELLATQFESHYAREAFPCIDEPEAKAKFDVTLITEEGVTVLGNMPVKHQEAEGELLTTTFDTTPRMSTYLIAWVVGELQKKTAQTKSGVEVNLWATPAQPAASLDFGLDIAIRTIDFFDDYFGVPYPLPKSDHVALPDFSSGAMENWGLITYRESALLAEPATTSLADKRYAATVIAHELSHQWFGNLVTMKWWNDLWLNESFANMMEYIAIDALEPTWDVWFDHATTEVISALRRDALDGVQAIQSDVHHPDEISTLFDPSIVYAKGGRLLRMLQAYIGDDAFRAGLSAYFKQHAYENTSADDLWTALGEASGKNVPDLMNTWMTQPGYPVVSVSQNDSEVTISQEQFFIGPHRESKALWPIPLHSTCGEMPETLSEKQVKVTRSHTSPLRFNSSGTSHYITQYDEATRETIMAQFDDIPTLDKLHFLHESTLLIQSGRMSAVSLIPLIEKFKNEENEAVWSMVALAIAELKKFVQTDEASEQKLRQLVGSIASVQYARLKWDPQENEPEEDTKLRSLIIGLMLYSEDTTVTNEAQRRYQVTDLEALDPELRSLILGAVVKQATNSDVIDFLLKTYAATSHVGLKDDITSGLTATKDDGTIARLAALLKDTKLIRPQDFSYWFVGLLRNRYARDYMWQWIRDNWPWVQNAFKGDANFDSFPRYIAGSLYTRKQRDEYIEFFAPFKDDVVLKRNIALGITELDGRIELIERDGDAVRQALLKRQ